MLDDTSAGTGVAVRKSPSQVVAEYNEKRNALAALNDEFMASVRKVERECRIEGHYGDDLWGRENPAPASRMERVLLKSAWRYLYSGMQIDTIATAKDKKRLDSFLENPTPFTLENIRDEFGDYLLDTRYHILRGLAEVFCSLDDFYKSHSKTRVGVKGLPKRVIIDGFNGYSEWGRNKVRDLVNAIETYRGKPRLEGSELYDALPSRNGDRGEVKLRGLTIRRFANGNAHVYFDEETLRDTNKALAEFYGDVLPDESGAKPEQKATGTAVSKDLQYYPTPRDVADRAAEALGIRPGEKVLEPSCGCGRLMEAAAGRGAEVFGVEYDPTRAAEARARGFNVQIANFLETVPVAKFDGVLMNPPFYGLHYLKHIEHAKKFLKPNSTLVAILPATARYDRDDLKGSWSDLPIGSFRESGTNVNTVLYTWHSPR